MEYTPEDEQLIQEKFDDLMRSCEAICKSEEDKNFIKKAFFLAKEAHKGVRRRSGEPYMLHPIAVAKIVVEEIGLGVKSVVASLLHDVVEDTEYTVEDIRNMFGPKIATMVDGLTKMSGVFNADTSEQVEYFRKVLLTLSDDVRVILIKIADRLHNMRTLGSMPVNKQIKITSETIYLFAPLAYRLGLYSIKTELEDLCMMYRFPEQYREISEKLNNIKTKLNEYIDRFNAPIIEVLKKNGIDFEISGRIKSPYSIWTKMQRKQISFEEVYDLFAIRIVFQPLSFPSEKTQCWQIYSSITDIYTPKPDRLRDWISMPKANGYEALHSTVMGPDGVWVEVQIRTQRMEDIAERGFAAHWKYKHATLSPNEDEFDKWLKKVREALNSPTENAVDFLEFSTIHSGDQIEIITSDNTHPKPEWLEHVTTAKAKQSIKNYLKKDRQHNISRGMKLFEDRLKEMGISPSRRVFVKVLPAYDCTTKDELYSKLGAGILNLDNLEKILRQNSTRKILKFWTLFLNDKDHKDKDEDAEEDTDLDEIKTDNSAKKSYVVGNESPDDSPQFVIAECCKPIPGDMVVGYRDPESGKIYVHKSTCSEFTRLASQFGQNIVKEEIKWSQHKAVSYLSTIELRGIDRIGIIYELAKLIKDYFHINIREIHIQSHDGIFEGNISLYIKSIQDLNQLMDKIRAIKGIEVVKRNLN